MSMSILTRFQRLLRPAKKQGLEPRQQALYDVMRGAREAALPRVPRALRPEFAKRLFGDQVLEAAAPYLLSSFHHVPQWMDAPPDPWRHNAYVATYLRGLLQVNGFDERVRQNQGDPERIAQALAEWVATVAFWLPRNN